MFKVESYVTPFILSYVDKYVKNIKPEDSRVSLWGGDAVFHNLDLKLDVLEEELHSPFTFSSGHIHELRIHVPWTKLASESTVITINTIECTFKLKSHEDRASQRSGQGQKPSRSRRQEIAGSPPGYVQSLLSKIVNNISIVCNNVILKYLEEDIVLSLNARTLAVNSVDSNWETAFIDLTAPDYTLRKLITVTDLTMCLDQCNALGKIPAYQEPLLYRSSFTIRLASTYPNIKGIRASKVRLDWLFPKLDFSLSDQQIPMFMRLFNLVLALYLGEFNVGSKSDGDSAEDASVPLPTSDDEKENSNNQSWAGWAWSYVPAILPVYPEDESGDVRDIPSERERVVSLGVYMERVNIELKWTEPARDAPISSETKRLRFKSFLAARLQGCFLDVTLEGVEWVDVQGGVSHLTLEPCSTNCLCGAPEEGTLYYLQGCERTAFLKGSLYDPDCEQTANTSDSMSDWDSHINKITEATLLERTPALGFDYVYQLELPEENASEFLSQLGSELEYSNFYERALFRLAVGPFQLKISYGLCHRLSVLEHAANQYCYPDYTSPGQYTHHRQRAAQEANVNQLLSMAGNLPKRTYQVAILRPLVLVSLAPIHPPFDLQRLVEKRVIRQRSVLTDLPSLSIPVLKINCSCADFRLTRPMYPLRIIFTLQTTPSVPAGLAQQSNSEMNLKLHDLTAELVTEDCQITLLRPSNSVLRVQSTILPELWKDHVQQVLLRCTLEMETMSCSFTRPQLDYVFAMWRSLTNPADPLLAIPPISLATASLRTKDHSKIDFGFHGIRLDFANTAALICIGMRVSSVNVSIAQSDVKSHVVLTSTRFNDERPFVEFLLQVPQSVNSLTGGGETIDCSGVPLILVKMGSYNASLHPDLFTWFESSFLSEEIPENESSQVKSIERLTSYASNQSICARDSGLSSSLEGHTWREAPSSVVLSHSTPTKPSYDSKLEQPEYKEGYWLAYPKLLRRSLLHVDILRGELITYSTSDLHKGTLLFHLPSIYVSCPNLPVDTLTMDNLPFCPSETSGVSDGGSSFPWSISVQDFTLESNGSTILEPVSLKMTVALNSSSVKIIPNESGPEPKRNQSPNIDLCIHVDMNAVEVKMTSQQVKLVSEQAADLCQWLTGVSTSTSSEIRSLGHQEVQTHFELGLWLQWAMPRFLLSLETPGVRSVLDMEDVTTSVDYQHGRFAKIKTRLTSISIKLLTWEEKRWTYEPGTNGIVLSCSDDITRDLCTHPDVTPQGAKHEAALRNESTAFDPAEGPIATSDCETDQEPRPKPVAKVSGMSNGPGGVITVTWTQARRRDVYSKWSGNSEHGPSSNQTEEQAAENLASDGTEPLKSDAYLHEVDLLLEAIDLVITEKLLEHLWQLVDSLRPALDRAFSRPAIQRPAKPEVNLPVSSQSLPLMFAFSKGIRLFLVDERFILFNVDRIELSPRTQNPIDRCTLLRSDLYSEAERSGFLNTPGNDVEDRQCQLDLNGLSISSGLWSEVAKASWIRRTMNPAAVLHTMVENPALEWNARQLNQEETREEALVGMRPILARCSLRTVFAPPIVSLEHECIVAGQAIETSASSDLRLFIDISELEHYKRWTELLIGGKSNEASPQTNVNTFPSHAFVTCNKINVIIYERGQIEEETVMNPYVPLASLLFIQPHVLYKNFAERSEMTLEWSIYDARFMLSCWTDNGPIASTAFPEETSFPISLIETLAGEPNYDTGIPPSLLTVRHTSTRQLSLEFGRPLKLFPHVEGVRVAQHLAHRLASIQQGQTHANPSCQPDDPLGSNFDELSVKTSQVLLELPLAEAGILTCGWNEVSLELSRNEGRLENFTSANVKANAICIQVTRLNEIYQMCDPFSFECRLRVVCAPQNESDAWSPGSWVRVSCQADSLRVHIGPRQMRIVEALTQSVQEGVWSTVFQQHSPNNEPPNSQKGRKKESTTQNDRQFFDDLRMGAFDFQVCDAKQPTSMPIKETPKPYQVVFNLQPPSMTWVYPQPRALTRVDIYPIPLLKADSGDPGTEGDHVDCSLEYWDDCVEEFRIMRKFSLSETRFTRVPLPNINNDSYTEGVIPEDPVFSNMWRVVMNFCEENVPEQRPQKIIAAPPSLVACTKIDSYSSARMIPSFQLHCAINHASLSLHNQTCYQTPSAVVGKTSFDNDFQLDGVVPGDFPFATISLNSTSISFRSCSSGKIGLDLSTQLQVNVTDLECLVDEPLIEPTGFDLKIAAMSNDHIAVLLKSQPSLDVNLSQRTLRTLSSCLASWNLGELGLQDTDPQRGIIFTDYLIRNDTQQVLRIGQHGTGESVLLGSRSAHQYAWKLIVSDSKKLHACTEGSRWRWCQPIRLDRCGTFVRSVTESRPSIPLVWTIRSLRPTQKEITISGQIQVGNLFPFGLEVKLVPVNSANDTSNVVLSEIRAIVPASSLAPSFVFPLDHLQAVKVRIPGSIWSGSIPLPQYATDSKPRNVLLVRVVRKDNDEILNMWCHLLTEKVDHQHSRLIVIFSPLYVVRSYLPLPLRLHLRTPGLNLSHHCEIEGQGRLSILQTPGTVDHSHMISFQLSSDLPESTPAVPLSWTMVSQYTNSNADSSGSAGVPFIDDIIEDLFKQHTDVRWPFADEEDVCSKPIAQTKAPQLKTDVRVAFSTLNKRCHSLLIELKPWALLVNRSGSDLFVKRNGKEAECWPLPRGSTVAPPPLNDGTFQLGLYTIEHKEVSYSQPLLLQDSEHYHFMSYRPRVDGAIPLEGYCFVRVPLCDNQIAFFTVSSKSHDGIRILVVEPTVRLRNELGHPFNVGCYAGNKDACYRSDQVPWHLTNAPEDGLYSSSSPLLIWTAGANVTAVDNPLLFISVRLCGQWSCPIKFSHPGLTQPAGNAINPQRYSISIPLLSNCSASVSSACEIPINCPLVVQRIEQSGCIYFTVTFDSNPSWVLINRTSHCLLYAQASDSEPGAVESDCSALLWNGDVQPDSVAYYTPPWNQQRHSDISPATALPRLTFALSTEQDPVWCQPVHPSHAYDQFVNLAPDVDVMIRIERTGEANQTAVFVEPVTQRQVSASEVRGRIAPISTSNENELQPISNSTHTEIHQNQETFGNQAGDMVCFGIHQYAARLLLVNYSSPTWAIFKKWSTSLYFPELAVSLRDDTIATRREVARLTVDHVLIEMTRYSSAPIDETKCDLNIYCGHVQLDNQLFQNISAAQGTPEDEEVGAYDFPVVFCAQNNVWPAREACDLSSVREKPMIMLNLSFAPVSLLAVRLKVEPVFLFIEDRFLTAMSDYLQSVMASYLPVTLLGSLESLSDPKPPCRAECAPFPERISEILSSASVLISLDRLLIDTVDLDLSLRSSLKLYIALDHSPLRLGLFERTHIRTTPYRLGQALAMHYVSSALLKAGWVVGSLELLGSPTALARTVSLGLRDFVQLPYQGIWRGPRGFVAGVLNGSASLVSHVTSGTITSVTQLASSVARNVDRLSFDSDFQQRSEEGRRKKPQGLIQGISWGMGAFGLSLLGALGGLAHHPLQSLIEEGTVTPRNLAVGLTKGIVGVVAKPISGAADLVAQTGQGLLSATKWREPFQSRYSQSSLSRGLFNSPMEMICSGSAKILWKVTDDAPAMSFSGRGQDSRVNRICCCMEAMRARVNEALPIREQLAPVLLVISTQNFCVLNAEDGEVQVVLDLNEVDSWAHEKDPTLLLVRPKPLNYSSTFVERRGEEVNPSFDYERVNEFVRTTTPFFLPETARFSTKESAPLRESSSGACSVITMEFFINPAWKAFFLQCFQLAKRQRKGLGFVLL